MMSRLNFDEVKLFEDTETENDIIRSYIDEEHDRTQVPFCILDVADVIQKHRTWIEKMPRVVPHYAVKCNSNLTVIKLLAAMNASFDCASEKEISKVMQYGVSSDRIIFANPAKWPVHIKFAKKMNVEKMTVDSETEILKINNIFPKAKIVIRIRCDATHSTIPLGTKFGCDPNDEVIQLIHLTRNLGLTLWGFSFHVGSPCGELNAYRRGIAMCKQLIAIAKMLGCKDARLIDIGGGFIGTKGYSIDKVANIINEAIQDIDPSITIISEPGQYYVTSAFTLASFLHTKRIVCREEKMIRMYYMTCGVYNGFIEELLNINQRIPKALNKPASDEKFLSYVWGPTCDSLDCILKDALLPEFEPGDWLIWSDMGSYSIDLRCNFNSLPGPKICPFMRKSEWEEFTTLVNAIQNTQDSVYMSNNEVQSIR